MGSNATSKAALIIKVAITDFSKKNIFILVVDCIYVKAISESRLLFVY